MYGWKYKKEVTISYAPIAQLDSSDRLLSDRSEVRILLGVPKSAYFSEKTRKIRHFLIFSYFGEKLVLQGNGAVVWASDSRKKFCAFWLTVLARNERFC